MGTILNFPRHQRYRCPPTCEGCCICEGGLFSCTRCGGAEASLTTDCPGEHVHGAADEVQKGLLDFKRDMGWHWVGSATGRITI